MRCANNAPQDIFQPKGPNATDINNLQKLVFPIAGVVGVIVLRKIARMNKVVLAVIVFVVVVIMGFSWVYERNEPAFLTPLVEKIAPFFPSKGAYGNQQQGGPKM